MKTCEIPAEKTVAAFKNYDFENWKVPEKYMGDYTHANFFRKYFIPIVRREIKALAKKLGATVKFTPMYFEWSACFGKNGKYIYVHCDDARWNDWYGDMYYRTVENEKGDRPGNNNWTSYDKLETELKAMFERLERFG